MTAKPRGPVILEVDAASLPEAPQPAEAPEPGFEPGFDPESEPSGADAPAAARAISVASRGGYWGLGRWIIAVLGALLLLWAGIAAMDFLTVLFAQGGWLGWIGAGLLGLLAALLALAAVRELAALARIGRIDAVRQNAMAAQEAGSDGDAEKALARLQRLYRRRADLAWALERFQAAQGDTPDPAGRLALAERELLAPLDARAEAAARKAARNVAAATALIPLALADVLAALTCNLRMIREIAEIYGGRAGWFGSWRLMRAVAAHLVATGAVAVADDLLGPLVGGGVLGKLSRRFGEGAVNGALTARVGIAAMEICRPLPFAELERPKASAIVLSALQGWRDNKHGAQG